MKKMFFLFISTALLSTSFSYAGSDKENRKKLENELKTKYSLTKIGGFASGLLFGGLHGNYEIKEEGAKYVLRKDGIYGLAMDTNFMSPVYIEDGKLSDSGLGYSAYMKEGDKIYLNKIKVGKKEVKMDGFSFETHPVQRPGGQNLERIKLQLWFKFPEEVTASGDFKTVDKAVREWILEESQYAASETVKIGLGQTEAEIKKALGEPKKILNLGSKTIYVYEDVKVTFVDEKVVDIQ